MPCNSNSKRPRDPRRLLLAVCGTRSREAEGGGERQRERPKSAGTLRTRQTAAAAGNPAAAPAAAASAATAAAAPSGSGEAAGKAEAALGAGRAAAPAYIVVEAAYKKAGLRSQSYGRRSARHLVKATSLLKARGLLDPPMAREQGSNARREANRPNDRRWW